MATRLVAVLLPLTLAANTTLLCKCACELPSFHQVETCSLCTKAFCSNQTVNSCSSQDVPIELLCFQRGSFKDEIIIVTFLVTTLSLLVWVLAIRPYLNGTLGWPGAGSWIQTPSRPTDEADEVQSLTGPYASDIPLASASHTM
ncbi:hypothetical protein HDU91_002067 [Kappamyces sp. JEL0680]|nr:hypothetical protein HDU91_002067 [Kappamyces sp. JEL0680]